MKPNEKEKLKSLKQEEVTIQQGISVSTLKKYIDLAEEKGLPELAEELKAFEDELEELITESGIALSREDKENLLWEIVYIGDIIKLLENYDEIKKRLEKLRDIAKEGAEVSEVYGRLQELYRKFQWVSFIIYYSDENDDKIRNIVVRRCGFSEEENRMIMELIRIVREISGGIPITHLWERAEREEGDEEVIVDHYIDIQALKKWLEARKAEYPSFLKSMLQLYEFLDTSLNKIYEKISKEEGVEKDLKITLASLKIPPEEFLFRFIEIPVSVIEERAKELGLGSKDIEKLVNLHHRFEPLKYDLVSLYASERGRENSWTKIEYQELYDLEDGVPLIKVAVFSGSKRVFTMVDSIDEIFNLGIRLINISLHCLDEAGKKGLRVSKEAKSIREGLEKFEKFLETALELEEPDT